MLFRGIFFLSGGNRCLDAFIVALSQAHDAGKYKTRWYVSTLELQLSSLEFCRACRNVPTLHVRVGIESPTTLWATQEKEPLQRPSSPSFPGNAIGSSNTTDTEGVISTRVPVVHAASLTWALGARELSESGRMDQWNCLDELRLERGVSWAELGSVVLPRRLKRLACEVEGTPIRATSLPESLQDLSLGHCFNQPISGVSWPASLLRLSFGTSFNQPLDGVVWPSSLQDLSFGFDFNQAITGVEWPTSLKHLSFSRRFNKPVEVAGVTWPASLRTLSFGFAFDQPIAGVLWPASLQKLSFGSRFDQPVTGVVWPSSLQQLTFGHSFDQPIERAA